MNAFEFKVLTDKDGRPVHLDNMSIDAAKAFLTFYQTLVSLAELSGDDEDTHIKIRPGSAVARVEGATAERIHRDFESVASAECTDPDIVKLWRDVQTQVQANGLLYEINHITPHGVDSLYGKIKESKTFLKKPSRSKYSNSIKFFSGRLINVGGLIPNIHVEIDGKKVTVDCKEEIALSAKDYLYKPIRFAVWAKEAASGSNSAYELGDVYKDEKEYQFFKNYFEALEQYDKIAGLTNIHRHIKQLLADSNFYTLQRLLNLWVHPSTDIQTMKIILVITKAFADDRRISEYIQELKEYFKIQDLKLSRQLKRK